MGLSWQADSSRWLGSRTMRPMNISARVTNFDSTHSVEVSTEGRWQSLSIAPTAAGRGSSVNGGELLFAALATCFCNDLYREAARRNIAIHRVDVEVTGTFGGPGEPARDITYRVQVEGDASRHEIDELVRATDALTEVQNTLRSGCDVRLATDVSGR